MRPSHVYVLLHLLLIALTLVLASAQPSVVADLQNFAFDTFQRLAPPPYDPDVPVRVLAIDETSLDRFGQWPWPRTRIAELVARLRSLGASAIAFDILFAEPDRSSIENVLALLADHPAEAALFKDMTLPASNDSRLAAAMADGPVVLGGTMTGAGPVRSWTPKAGFAVAGDEATPFIPSFRTAVLPIPVLREAAGGLGATNWLPDKDQIVRKVPLFLRVGDQLMPALALEALRVALGASTFVLRASNASGTSAFGSKTGLNAIAVGGIEIPTGAHGIVRPRYSPTDPRRILSAADLLEGRVAADQVRGRVIFVGTTAVGLGDIRATPLDAAVPGVEVHAQLLEQVLTGRLLSRPDWAIGAEVAVTILCIVGLGLLLPRVAPLMGSIIGSWIVTLFVLGSWIWFTRLSILIDPVIPSVTVGLTYLLGASLLWQTERRSRRQVRAAFGKFVAPAVVSRIAERPELLVLSGETRNLTILFSDLRNFSTISEGLTAAQVAQFLNLYLTPMTDTILEHEGTVDKYIGDAIVAFWNAPLDVADHTTRAVEAALAMRRALANFNRENRDRPAEEGRVLDVRMGIGLNYGACSVGNMGSTQRFDYSALGDPVNVAARLEALTKTYGVDLLATVAVQERTARYAWLEVDAVKVKGRSAVTKLFTLVGSADFAATEHFAQWSRRHGSMLHASRHARPLEATQIAEALAVEAEDHWRPLYEILARSYRAEIGAEAPASTTAVQFEALATSTERADLVARGDTDAPPGTHPPVEPASVA